MKKGLDDYSQKVEELFPETFIKQKGEEKSPIYRTITFQVTEGCNLRCTYCYQINKHPTNMTIEVAKKFIDNLLENRFNKDYHVNEYNTKGLIIDFIGGEPFINMPVVEFVTEYFENWFANHPESPWSFYHIYNFSTNGTLYTDERVHKYIEKYKHIISLGITVDGCKACHDACRLFEDGRGSYDLAMYAATDALKNYEQRGTKITLSPYNVEFIYESIVNMIENEFDSISINCAFEEGWTIDNAKTIYHQFKKVSDYIKENDLYDDLFIRMLEADAYKPSRTEDIDSNFCGGTNSMLALQPSGKIYTCIRFMDTSLGKDVKDLPIGHIDHGIGFTDEEKANIAYMESATIRSQSPKECLECPIGAGCSFCTAYNYQHFGEFKRATYICDCHKAAALAAKYLAKIMRDKDNYDLINIPEDWALRIIDKPEWDFINNYEGE